MDINMTILGQTIAFMVFVWFCMKYVWPPLMNAIEERQEKIAEGLEASQKGEKDLQRSKKRAKKRLAKAKIQAAEIIDQANKRHAQIVDSAKEDARAEAAKIKVGAATEIEQEIHRAKEQLRGQVSMLAIQGAEKILARTVDADAHQDILNKLSAEL